MFCNLTGLLTGNVETRDSFLVIELKAQSLCVVAQLLNARKLEVNKSLVTTDENLLTGGLGGGSTGAVAVEPNTGARETDSGVDGSQRLALGSLRRVFAQALWCCSARFLRSSSELFQEQKKRARKEVPYLLERLSAPESLTREHLDVQLT